MCTHRHVPLSNSTKVIFSPEIALPYIASGNTVYCVGSSALGKDVCVKSEPVGTRARGKVCTASG